MAGLSGCARRLFFIFSRRRWARPRSLEHSAREESEWGRCFPPRRWETLSRTRELLLRQWAGPFPNPGHRHLRPLDQPALAGMDSDRPEEREDALEIRLISLSGLPYFPGALHGAE